MVTMLQTPLRRLSFSVLGTCLLLLAGCGGTRTVNVSGKLNLPDNLKLVSDDAVNVILVPVDSGAKANNYTAKVENDHTFICRSVVPGKYKVTANFEAYPGKPGSAQRNENFKILNKTFDKNNSPLTYEVSGDAEQSITIDLTSKTVTKG
jgi:hypothetical protein